MLLLPVLLVATEGWLVTRDSPPHHHPAQAHNVLIVLIICDHLSPASPAGAVSQWARLLSHN